MLDLILGILFLYLVLVGAYRGFIELLIKSSGIAIGIFLSFRYTKSFSSFLSQYFKANPLILDFVAFSLIFLFVLSLSFLFYAVIKNFLHKKKKFSFIDKVVGATGGAIIFLIIVSFLAGYSHKNKLVYDLTKSSKIISALKK